jgi:hypothetical protein
MALQSHLISAVPSLPYATLACAHPPQLLLHQWTTTQTHSNSPQNTPGRPTTKMALVLAVVHAPVPCSHILVVEQP